MNESVFFDIVTSIAALLLSLLAWAFIIGRHRTCTLVLFTKPAITAFVCGTSLCAASVATETRPENPIRVTLCKLADSPDRYSGKLVTVRATIEPGYEAGILTDERHRNCSGRITFRAAEEEHNINATEGAVEYTDYPERFGETPPPHLIWRKIPHTELKRDSEWLEFERYLGERVEFADPRILCQVCPVYKVTATLTGRFEYAKGRLRAVRDSSRKILAVGSFRFGHLGMFDSQLTIYSVEKVSATRRTPERPAR